MRIEEGDVSLSRVRLDHLARQFDPVEVIVNQEDDRFALVQKYLSQWRWEIHTCSSPDEALNLVEAGYFEVVELRDLNTNDTYRLAPQFSFVKD